MIEFKPVTKKDGGKLRKYYKNYDYGLCEYSIGTVLMWRRVLRPAWAEVAGCLVIKNAPDGRTMFEYPVPGPEGDVDAALLEIEKHCIQYFTFFVWIFPEIQKAPMLCYSQNIGAGGTGYSVLEGLSYPVEMKKARLVSLSEAIGPVSMEWRIPVHRAGSTLTALEIYPENIKIFGPVNFAAYGPARPLKRWVFRPNIVFNL